MSQVTELTTLTGFGFSLDGKVDVDDNGYRGDMHASMKIFLVNSCFAHIHHILILLLFQIWLSVLLAMSQDKQCLC